MKKLRLLVLFFITFFTATSILVDWNDISFNTNSKNIERTMFTDKYEDHNLQMTHLTLRNAVVTVKKRYVWIDDYFYNLSINSDSVIQLAHLPNLDIRCAIKSYLHLLQLF